MLMCIKSDVSLVGLVSSSFGNVNDEDGNIEVTKFSKLPLPLGF